MKRARPLAVVLALMLVLAPMLPFAAAGSAAAAPAGMSTIPDASVTGEVPSDESIPLSASELEGGVMASDHAGSLEVILTTAEHAPTVMGSDSAVIDGDGMAVVLRDDSESAGREVALDAGQLQDALGYRPEAIHGTHEDGSEWTATAEYVDGYLVFDVPHFSSNTVTFSGEVTIDAAGATNGTQFEYSVDESESVSDASIDLTGVENTGSASTSAIASNGDTIGFDVGGTAVPRDETVTIEGVEETTDQSYSAGFVSDGFTDSLAVGGNQPARSAEVTFTGKREDKTASSGVKTTEGEYSYTLDYDPSNVRVEWEYTDDSGIRSLEIDTDGDGVADIDKSVGVGDSGVEEIPDSHMTDGTNNWEFMSGGGVTQVEIIGDKTIKTEDPSVSGDGWAASYSGTLSDGETVTKSASLSPGSESFSTSTTQGQVGVDISWTEVTATEDPSVTVGNSTVSHTGVLGPGQTVTESVDLSTGTQSADVSVNGPASVTAEWTEVTDSVDPVVELNSSAGTQTISHSGTLADGETVDLSGSINESLIGGSTSVTVNVDGPASGPAAQVDLNYSHSAQDKISTNYQASTFEESYNISHTYSDATENAQATIPFASSRVVGVKNVEYRVDGGSWSAVASENYRFSGTTLDVYLDDATGGVDAGQTVEVRATGRKISVDNGAVSVTDPTAPGEDLDTQLKVDSRSPGFAVNVGPTDDGDRVHYAYSDSFPTEDYVVIQANGDQQLFMPNSVVGDTFRVSHLDTRVVAERGDVRIDVVEPGENPELDVSPGPGGDGDPVTVEYYNTESGITYLLNSLTRNIVVDSDTAESPAIFEDDDSDDTWAILRDSGPTGSSSDGTGAVGQFRERASGAVGSVSLPIDGSGLGQLALVGVLGLGGVVALRRFWPSGGDGSDAVTRDTGTGPASGAIGSRLSSLAVSIGLVGKRAAQASGRGLLGVLRRFLGWIGSVTAIILGNRRASVAAAVVSAIVAARVGLVQLPEGSGILIVVSGVPLATWLIMRQSDALSQRVWVASTVAAVVLGLEFVAPGTIQTAIEQLTSEQVAPLLLLLIGGLVYYYLRIRGKDASTPDSVTNVEVPIGGGDDGEDDGS